MGSRFGFNFWHFLHGHPGNMGGGVGRVHLLDQQLFAPLLINNDDSGAHCLVCRKFLFEASTPSWRMSIKQCMGACRCLLYRLVPMLGGKKVKTDTLFMNYMLWPHIKPATSALKRMRGRTCNQH